MNIRQTRLLSRFHMRPTWSSLHVMLPRHQRKFLAKVKPPSFLMHKAPIQQKIAKDSLLVILRNFFGNLFRLSV